MSLAEIEKAIDQLPAKELTKVSCPHRAARKLAWGKELEEDFVPATPSAAAAIKTEWP